MCCPVPHLPITPTAGAAIWGQQTFTETLLLHVGGQTSLQQARKHTGNPSQVGQQPDVHDQNSHYLPKVVSVLPIV